MPEPARQDSVWIEGHASVFDLADLSQDIVARGAFARSLAGRQRLPMLFQHEASDPVGVWTHLREDQRGLFVRGEILTGNARGRSAASLVSRGAVDGLSIGFRTRAAQARKPRGRHLLDIDLWEVSIVTFPMLPQARLRVISNPAQTA